MGEIAAGIGGRAVAAAAGAFALPLAIASGILALTSTSTADRSQDEFRSNPLILFHYATAPGLIGIVASQQINPSLAANNPNDVSL